MNGRSAPVGEAVKTWAGTTGFWSGASNWTPAGAPAAGDTLNFPTLTNPYTSTNNLAPAAIYSLISIGGSSTGKPTLVGGFRTEELFVSAAGNPTFRTGLYEVRGQTTFSGTSVSRLESGATLVSSNADHTLYLWEQSNTSVGNGALLDLASSLVALDDSAQLAIEAGGVARAQNLLMSNDSSAGEERVSVVGSGANLRVDFQTLLHTDGFAAPSGTTSIEISQGGLFSTGILITNQAPTSTAAGAVTRSNLTVSDGTLLVNNAVGFENSYFSAGASQGPGETVIDVTNGGQFRVSDTDGAGQAFAVFSSHHNQTVALHIGGTNAQAVGSTMQIDGLLFAGAAPSAENTPSSPQVNMTIDAGGRLLVRDASLFAMDRGTIVSLAIHAGGLADLGNEAVFGGGNGTQAPTGGGGHTAIVVDGGELRAGLFELAADPASGLNAGYGSTHLVVRGATGRVIADGADDPATPQLDSGFFTLRRENPAGGLHGELILQIEAGGKVEANEAFFAGDVPSSNTAITVSGAGSTLDAGGLFAMNDTGQAGASGSITLQQGGRLIALAASDGEPGLIRINPRPGSAMVSLTIDATSTIQSASSLSLGGRLVEGPQESVTREAGSPVDASAAGLIIAGGAFYLGPTSTLNSGARFSAARTYIDGQWRIGDAGSPLTRPTTGNLFVSGSGKVELASTNSNQPVLMLTRNVVLSGDASIDLGIAAMRIRPDSTSASPTTLTSLKQMLDILPRPVDLGRIYSGSAQSQRAIGYALVDLAGTFLGEPTQPGDLLLRHTFKGDADLDGAVDFDDLLILAQHYNDAGEWFEGDFTRDLHVGFDDLLALAQNYGLGLAVGVVAASTFDQDWALARSLVPEPGLGLCVVPMLAGIRRRR